jgi:hypothetical protein
MDNSFVACLSPNRVDWNGIEDIRLGTIITDAKKCRYESADEIISDIKLAALTAGIRVIGEDEVDIGEEWEHVFEVRGREVHFRTR